jgi:Lon protease-like protein
MNEDLHALHGFDDTTRLFPLPNVVLFPHVVQPLHIFEPRYRQMTEDSLAGDRFLSIVLLMPGWEAEYHDKPTIHKIACLGRIVADQRQEDGRYNLLLRGLARVRIVSEIESDKPYRSAHVEVLQDVPANPPHVQQHLRRALSQIVKRWLSNKSKFAEQFQSLIDSDITLGALADIFSFALPMAPEFKQELLEEVDVEKRIRYMVEHLKTLQPPEAAAVSDRPFPPGFSSN